MQKSRRHAETNEATVSIPIPAFLDMAFQLLSFCVVTFNPPSVAEGQLNMYLPAAGVAKAQAAEDVDPFAMSSTEVEPPADVTVVVESSSGAIGRLAIREKERTTEVANVKELQVELEKLQQQLGQANVKVEAESTLKYAFLIEVMDACLQAKFTSVGFAPPPDLTRR